MTDNGHLQPLLDALLAVCEAFTTRMEDEGPGLLSTRARVKLKLVMLDPYVPFLPMASPRVLVLAESQNLSATNRLAVGSYEAPPPR